MSKKIYLCTNNFYTLFGTVSVPPFFYRKYPKLCDAIRNRNRLYNQQMDWIETLENEGKLLVIRPELPIIVDRMERDTKKLLDLYQQGYECAAKIQFDTPNSPTVTPDSQAN